MSSENQCRRRCVMFDRTTGATQQLFIRLYSIQVLDFCGDKER